MERPLHELYSLLYSLAKKQSRIYGICLLIDKLCYSNMIRYDEWNKLLSHLKSEKPDLVNHRDFYSNHCFNGDVYWWSNDVQFIKESTQQRKLFIKRMKEITKNTKQ